MDPILHEHRLHQGHGRRADEGARQGSALQFSEGDKGRAEIMAFIQERLALDPRAAAARVQHARPRQPRSEAPAARGRTGRAGRLRRRRIDRRQDSRASSGSTCGRPICTASTASPTWPITKRSPATSGRATTPTSMPLIRSLLAFNAYSEGWALYAEQLADELGRLRRLSGRPARLPAVDRLPRLPPGGRHRHSRQALDPRAGRRLLRRAQRLESDGGRERGRPLLLVAGPGLRLQGRPQRDQPPARAGARPRSARATTCGRSTTRWCMGGNVPLDVLAPNSTLHCERAR